jgi:hypothetical protein
VRNAWNAKAEFAVNQGARWTEHTDFVSASFGSRKLPSRLRQAKAMFKKLFSKSRYANPKTPSRTLLAFPAVSHICYMRWSTGNMYVISKRTIRSYLTASMTDTTASHTQLLPHLQWWISAPNFGLSK